MRWRGRSGYRLDGAAFFAHPPSACFSGGINRISHDNAVEFRMSGKILRAGKNAFCRSIALKLRVIAKHFDLKTVAVASGILDRTARLAVVEMGGNVLRRHCGCDADMGYGLFVPDFRHDQSVLLGQIGDLPHGVGWNVRHQIQQIGRCRHFP